MFDVMIEELYDVVEVKILGKLISILKINKIEGFSKIFSLFYI